MSSTPAPTKIAFLGLGLMGRGMAQRLLGAGFAVAVFNRTRQKAEALGAAGARIATSPRDAAEGADVIISMVADDGAARNVWLDADGALSRAQPGTLLIESSTVSVAWVRELAAAAAAKGCELIDAPVTGSKPQAAAGELFFMAGGSAQAFERARPLLRAMGRSSVLLGPLGSGALLKLINNFVCGVQAAALAEAMAVIERSGLNRSTALEIITGGAPGSPLVKTLTARMTAPDFTPNFLLRLMAKDLAYATEEAAKRSVELVTAAAASVVFQRAIAAGHGEKDLSAIVEPFREATKPSA